MQSKEQMLSDLRAMLHDAFVAKAQGETHLRLARVHGYIDGFMKALLDCAAVTKEELLEVVASERERVSGPAIRSVEEISQSGEIQAA